MSSLAAARADNFYFPPDYQPEYGSLSKFNNKNFNGSNQYQQFGIIRFELPFDGWCLHCNHHMSKGLRFNAKKDKDGKYFTTQIWSFVMKCPECNKELKIKTDPKNCTYDFVEGIRKHEQDYIPDLDDNVEITNDNDIKQMMAIDPMYRLQHYQEDQKKIMTEQERFQDLIDIQEQQHKHDYDLNSKLRSSNRKQKKRRIALLEEATSKGLSIPLLEYHPDDQAIASNIVFKKHLKNRFQTTESNKMLNIQSQSIFNNNNRDIQNIHTTTNHKLHTQSSKHINNKLNIKSNIPIYADITHRSNPNHAYNQKTKLIAKSSALQIDSKCFVNTSTNNNHIKNISTNIKFNNNNNNIVIVTNKKSNTSPNNNTSSSQLKKVPISPILLNKSEIINSNTNIAVSNMSEISSSNSNTTTIVNDSIICNSNCSLLNMLAYYDD